MAVDAAAAKLGKAALDASVKSVGESTAKSQQPAMTTPEESPFKQMLNGMGSGSDFAASIGVDPSDIQNTVTEVQSLSAEGITPLPEWLDVGPAKESGMTKVVDLLSEVNHGQMKMDNFLNEILYGGRKFSNQELLAVQAHIYHFAQLTELTVKVAEQGTSAVKTILNTQVQ